MSDDFFLGASDMAARNISTTFEMQDDYRATYEEDLRKYGKELTPDEGRREVSQIKEVGWEWAKSRAMDYEKDRINLRELIEVLSEKVALEKEDGIYPVQLVLRLLEAEIRGEWSSKFWEGTEAIEDDPTLGEYAELVYAEPLPKVRLISRRRGYVIMGAPDGIGQDFVYEFKETRRSSINPQKRQAERQGSIYAWLFGVSILKIEVAQYEFGRHPFPMRSEDLPKPKFHRFESSVNAQETENMIDHFIDMIDEERQIR